MRIASLALFVSALCLASCDDGIDNFVVNPTFVGTYVLETADGEPLPAVIADSTSPPLRIEVLAGHITLRVDRSFEYAADFRQTLGGIVTNDHVVCVGVYTVSGRVVSFAGTRSAECADRFTATLDGGSLTAVIRGVSLLFVR